MSESRGVDRLWITPHSAIGSASAATRETPQMEDAITIVHPAQESIQSVLVRVPLDSAADAFVTRDAWGRLPITLVPSRAFGHLRSHLRLAGIGGGVAVAAASVLYVKGVLGVWWLTSLTLSIAFVLIVPVLWSAFVVHIPEGASGLLMRGGKYLRAIESGAHFAPPWIGISHLVTRREIPLGISVDEALTKDDVRATVETLIIVTIADPYRFVFVLPPDDYERILRAYCQEAARVLVRRVTAAEVTSLSWDGNDDLLETINADMAPYGVRIVKMKVAYARPSEAFLRLQELRRLAVLQQQVAAMVGQATTQAEIPPSEYETRPTHACEQGIDVHAHTSVR